ncbi:MULTISPECIES: (d)CMP kinase [Rhodomicrobium]|uniref:(d)CMP kinase n=1 Tax=Rhodomicrobium TaxID=1068 RepID=UPI000B4AF536|nr:MULTISPECIES: (d)CMP kinase [Rhodomicrobium]
MIIAIDGPAASGKGTLAKRIAQHYGLAHLDTGMLYRGVARDMLAAGIPLEDQTAAEHAARSLDPTTLEDAELRARHMGEAASVIAQFPAVRAALLEAQKAFAERRSGAVVEGRDIGTVIFPNADVKLFITADLAERARRRHLELTTLGESISEQDVFADLEKRDHRDQYRTASPLRMAEDAYLLDTTKLDIEAAFFAAVRLIDAAIGRSSPL